MPKQKLRQYADIREFGNVFEFDDASIETVQKNWKSFFQNERPLILELACGKGDYTLNLAREFPDKNFIGVDIKGARLWKAAKTATEGGLKNVCFLRCEIERLIDYFQTETLSEIWITFPDPFLRGSQQNKRLTAPRFMEQYERLLTRNSSLHIKTDSMELYQFSLLRLNERNWQIRKQSDNIYADFTEDDLCCRIQTAYEKRYLAEGRTIKYIQARFNP
ncbi:MAG: tRNA (guanosine(46)-N7)-methyltransferase TrmB [Calditrichaeota bacterium]|nr:tRNA (guanosine(46)-N7)-methyltransferase TrmB [Calditrichota bacterium]